jgi:hypothetical protein
MRGRDLRLTRATTLGLALALGGARCKTSTGFDQPACAGSVPATCSADGSCATHLDCPRGEVCSPHQQGSRGTCELDKGGALATALVDGFGVTRLDLTPVMGSTDGARFTWTSDPRFQLVRCALFACPLVFFPCEGGGAEIPEASVSRCLIGFADVTPPDNEIDVSALVTPPQSGAAPWISALQLGCWAYDEVSVVAASELQLIPPASAPALVNVACSAGADGQSCLLPDATVGTCLAETCRRRCATVADCDPDGGAADGGVPESGSMCAAGPPCDVGLCSPAGAPP